MFTKTETLRRLRVGAALIREAEGIPKNWKIEVGLRDVPAYASTVEAARSEDNHDLYDFRSLPEAAAEEEVRREGYIAHLYVTSSGTWGELETVERVWLGTSESEPVLL